MTDQPRKSAYGTPAGDTDFRAAPDMAALAQKGAAREAAEREERRARYEARLAGRKYHARTADGSEEATSARRAVFDASARVGTTQLLTGSSATTVGKRGRGAGFYCEACDLTFKDDKQWIEHVNGIQHLLATGQSTRVKRASVEEVLERIEMEWEKLLRKKDQQEIDLQERLRRRAIEEEQEREARRLKKAQAKKRKQEAKEQQEKKKLKYGDDVRNLAEHDEDDMMAAMGFTGFGTSKK